MIPDYSPGNPLFDRCFALAVGGRNACRLGAALEAPIPVGVKRYLLAETVELVESDLATSPRLQRLLGGDDPIGRTRKAILQGLAPLYEYTGEEFRILLGEGLLFTDRSLIRPLGHLTRQVIGGRESVPLDAVRAHFSRTAQYGYLLRLAEEVFRRRQVCTMPADEFRLLMEKIDDQVVQQHAAGELALLAKPIFDFLLCGDSGRDAPIPLEPILEFFDDKKMTIMREYIESISRLRDLRTITLDQLSGYIRDLTGEEGPGEPRMEAGEPAEGAPVESPSAMKPEPLSTVVPELSPPGTSVPDAPPGTAPIPQPPPPQTTEDEAPLLPDLRKMIGEKERQRFVKHVFQRDQAYFYGVIATLNTFWTWKEAAAYLQQVYTVNRLDPFDRDVVAFTDLIHRRFAEGGTEE